MASAAAAADAGITGVTAANHTIFIQAPLAQGNQVSVQPDATSTYIVVTLNGQSVAYQAAGVLALSYVGGVSGGDHLVIGAMYQDMQLTVAMLAGNNTLQLGTGLPLPQSTNVLLFGDFNTVTATGATTATIVGYGGPHDTATPAASFKIIDVSQVPYTASAIPGVFAINDEMFIIPRATHGNQVTLQAGSAGARMHVIENGVATSFGATVPSQVIYYGSLQGGDTLGISMSPLNVSLSFFGSGNTYSGGTEELLSANLYGAGDSVSIGATSHQGSTVYVYGSLTNPPSEQISNGIGTTRVTTPPMPATDPAGGGTTTGTTTGTGTTTATSTTGSGATTVGSSTAGTGSSSAAPVSGSPGGAGGCGMGGSLALVLGGLAWYRSFAKRAEQERSGR